MLNVEQCFHSIGSPPPLNDFDISTLLHRSSGNRSYPNMSFALFSLALSCSWEVLQNLCSNHLPILLTVPLTPVFRPNERLPSLNFRKARQDDFAFDFDSCCPSAEEYSSLFLSFAVVLFTSLTLNTIWCSGETALFLSLLAKTGLAYLPTALSVASRPPFSFQQAQYGQVFPLKPAPFCKLFAGLGSTNKSAISLLLLSDSRSVLATLFSPPSFLLPQSLSETIFFLLQFYQATMGPPDIRSFRTTTRLMSWPDGEHYLFPQQSLVVTLLISGIHSFLFSDCRQTVLSKFFDTQAPSISTEQLVLPGHARCDLSRLRCNGHSLLLSSYLSRIGRIENSSFLQRLGTPLISFCTVQLQTLCVARSLAIFCLSTTSVPGPG